MKRLISVSTLVVAVLVAFTTPAMAGPVVTRTETRKNVTESFQDVDPCLGLIAVTIVYNEVSFISEFIAGPNQGNGHVRLTQTGTFLLETVRDPSIGDFTGRFTLEAGFNFNRRNFLTNRTFNATGWSVDGTRIRFHLVEHFNLTAMGVEHFFSMQTIDCPV